MKTRLLIIIGITLTIFFVVPPNIAAYACNELQMIDVHCHIVGMNFLGIKFDTNIWYILDIEKHSKSCGGVLAHPDKAYPCSGMQSYWGLPTEYARYMEMDHYNPNKIENEK